MISLNEFYRFYTNNLLNATQLSRYSNFILWTSENVKFLVIFAFWEREGRKAIHGKLSSTIINNAVQTSSILTQAAIIKQRSTSSKSLTNFRN